MRYDIEIKNKAIEYYLVGYSANQVSKIVGVNEATIRKWIKEKILKLEMVEVITRNMMKSLLNIF